MQSLLVPGFGPDPCGGLNFHRKERVGVLLILGGMQEDELEKGFYPCSCKTVCFDRKNLSLLGEGKN